MKTLEISEKALLLILEAEEGEKYFPKGKFDISDRQSRIALREMLADAVSKNGRTLPERLEVDAFGSRKTGFNIFVRYT